MNSVAAPHDVRSLKQVLVAGCAVVKQDVNGGFLQRISFSHQASFILVP